MWHHTPRKPSVLLWSVLFLLGFLLTMSAGATSSPAALPARPEAGSGPDDLPNPVVITGSPLKITIGADSSIQTAYNGLGQVYGWQDKSADSGIWLQVGSDVYGPDSCFNGRNATNLYVVRPWSRTSHSGPTGSGTAGDPWVVTTVLDAGATGFRVTQRVSYVNGQDYFRLDWDIANTSGSSQTVKLYHAVDSYFANDDYGLGYYDAGSGAVGAYVPSGPWYMLFVPTSPATAHQEGWYYEIWENIGYCGDNFTCPVSGSCEPGPGFNNTIDTSPAGVDNGFGLEWQRTIGSGSHAIAGDWWTFGSIPNLPGQNTPTPTPTFTPTKAPTPTSTSTVETCNQTISASFGPPANADTWQRFTIPLTAAKFGIDDATFQKVMAQVTQFRIRTELHDGADVGGVDNVTIGSRFGAGFDAGPEGWTAAGDGTMEWKSTGGNPGGYLQVSDWATGDWHWAVAPIQWAGDWRNLVGSSAAFDLKTNYPDYASVVEISCTPSKRLTLTANPFVIAPGASSNMTVSLSENAPQAVAVTLNSSNPGCISVPASVTIAQGQTSAGFLAQATLGAVLGCEAVIEASHATYGVSRLTLHVQSITPTPTPTVGVSPTPTPTGTVVKPDLTITNLDRSGVTVDPQALTLSGNLGVQIKNAGGQAVNRSFRVTVFEDRDLNRALTPGTDLVLGQRDHTALFGASASEWFSVPVAGNVLFRDNLIYAFVDSQNEVDESDETNNFYDTGLLCGDGLQSRTYTTDADFDQGVLLNVNHNAPNSNQLQLNQNIKPPAFIWVALSGRGEIAKIDVNTGQIKGRYLSAPDGRARNPSRTTVDLYGSVWAGNRDEGDGGKGSALHIGLAENFQCVDRNGNGVIDTSTGDDVKPWPNTNGVDNNGGVATAQDECILHYVRGGSAGTRHVSVDKSNNVWISGNLFYAAGNRYFDVVDGGSGAILRTVGPFTCGGYGGLVDRSGVLWSASGDAGDWTKLLRYDPASGAAMCIDIVHSYGLAVDSLGNIWNSSYSDNVIKKVNPGGQIIGSYASSGGNPSGLAVSLTDNNVWVANRSSANLTRMDPNGNILATIPVGSYPTGVAVDANGKIWSVNRDSNNLMRINPQTNQVDLTVDLPPGSAPYNYSDMTGTQILGTTAPQGTWTVIYDSGAAGTPWGKIAWNSQEPAGSAVTARARSADTQAALGTASYVSAANGIERSLGSGRYIQVQIMLVPGNNNASPVVYDVTVSSRPSAADVTASYIRIQDNSPASVTFTARVGNGGSKGVPADLPVAFYDGNPSAGGSLLGGVRIAKPLAPGEYVDVSLTWNSPQSGSRVIYVRADDDGTGVGAISECNENNNVHSRPYQIAGGTNTPTPTPTRTATPTFTPTRTPTFTPTPTLTPTPTPTSTSTPTPTPTPQPDLTITRLEINQSIQNEANSIPLIASKRTVVRAYLGLNTSMPISGVTGELRGYRGSTLLGKVAPFNPGGRITAVQSPNWRQINQTLNFELPFSWLSGSVRLEVEVNPDRGVTESNYGNNITSTNLSFVDGGDLRIAWLPVHYNPGGYTGPQDPSERIAKGQAWLVSTFPVSHTRVKYYPWPGITWAGNVNVGTGGEKLLNYLIRLLQLSQARPRPDHVYGWLPTSVFWGNGLGQFPGHAAFGNDTDGRWRRTMTHEFGHNYNLGHWDKTIGTHGFDVAAREVREDTRLDFMVPARLENEAWIAPGQYTYLHERIVATNQREARPAEAVATEYLLASGLIDQDGTVTFDVFNRQVQTDPLDNPPVGTAYCLELYDAQNTKLSSQCFDVSYGFGDSTNPVTTAPFALTIPFPPNARQIVLKHEGATVATRTISNHKPTVNVAPVTGGAIKTVSWTASDPDNDSLSYSVLFSNDNRVSWYAVATDVTQTTFALDTATLPGGSSAYIRILASDGVNTAEGDAGPFTVSGKAPTALIISPADQAVYAPGDTVVFVGDGMDLEDGSLPDGSLTWSSDKDGELGTGRTLERSNLREGDHTITLTVVDSGGTQATAHLVLHIRRPSSQSYLPLLRRSLAPAPTPTPTRTPTPRPTATPTPQVSAGGIYGRVTYHGVAAPYLQLYLSQYDGDSWFTADVTLTDDNGRYSFLDAATLGAGELYSVDYLNTPDDPNPGPGYLWSWSGNRIASYTAGQSVAGGDFDVADVLLASPPDGATVTLPAAFCWTPRGITGDNYQFVLWNVTIDDLAGSDFLGNDSCFTMNALVGGWKETDELRWWVQVYAGADPAATPYNFGASYGDRAVIVEHGTTSGAGGASRLHRLGATRQ